MNESPQSVLCFLTYSLDAANAQLREGDSVIALRPKTLAVLHYLAERSGRLVTKAELLDAVWPDTAVSESTLTSSIKELRRALDDDPRRPRVIETAHKHGYRFIAEVQARGLTGPAVTGPRVDARVAEPPPNPVIPSRLPLVGRGRDLSQLDAWLASAFSHERLVAFVVGDAGMGKTALMDAFRARLSAGGVLVAHGQCLEHHGASEPYLPVLEGLERLCATPEGKPLLALLRRHAPTWLTRLLALLGPEESVELQRQLTGGTTRESMLREMASLMVALPAPLVIILEDLHWSDNATIDLVAALAQRRDPAPLLVIGTYRPVDAVIAEHPLRSVHQQLRAHGRSRELWLQALDEHAIAEYASARWPGLASAGMLARALLDRTDGNPLFVVSVADYLVTEGVIADVDSTWKLTADVRGLQLAVPQGLRAMIATQIDHLDEAERNLLEAGSVVGRTFSAAAVAAALDTGVVDVEARLERLARRGQLVRAAGEAVWPDGTVAGRYELTHSLYQNEFMDRVPPARRRQLHARIAKRMEAGYGARASEIATELGYHFEAGGQPDHAVPRLEEAAVRASQIGASREACALLQRALSLLDGLPPTPERALRTIRASLSLGMAQGSLLGPAAPESEPVWLHARTLSEQTDDPSQLFQSLAALSGFYIARARFGEAKEATEQLAALASRLQFPVFTSVGNMYGGIVCYHTGDLAVARKYLENAPGLDVVVTPGLPMTLHNHLLNYQAVLLMHLGYPDTSRARNRESAVQAETTGTPFDRAQSAMFSCFLNLYLRDYAALVRAADDAAAIGEDYGFQLVSAVAKLGHGRVRVADGYHARGLVMIREGIDAYRALRQATPVPTLLSVLADAEAEAGHLEDALLHVAEARALEDSTGDVRLAAELNRMEGDLRRRRNEDEMAERCYRRAIEIARDQGARWWELRATVSLARLLREKGKRAAARRGLASIVATFTEGLDTFDVRDAQRLLVELS